MKSTTVHRPSTAHRKHNRESFKGLTLFILLTLLTLYSFSQPVAYLDFRNPVLEAGTAGADGAQYRFSNVTTNIDAIVTIMGRSDALVNLLNPDMNTSGFDGAFQPQVGYNNGTTPGPADWWMQFNIQFFEHGTSVPAIVSDFNVSGVDIDGNSQYINEYLTFFEMQDYSLESGSGLSVTSVYEDVNGSMLSGKRFDGPVANYTNIDTSATTVMVSNHYVNKSSFIVRTGGRSTDVSGAADRMYSFYFQNFAYNTPYKSLLPLNTERIRPARRSTEQESALSAYPNPVASELNIKLPGAWEKNNVSIRVYDIHGNLVNGKLDNNTQTRALNVSSLKSGVYILSVVADNKTSTMRIIKL